MRVTILAVGSRGDVQPGVALGIELEKAGHQVCVTAADDFRGFVQSRGLDFRPLGVNVQKLLRSPVSATMLESGRNTLRGMWQMVHLMRPWLK